MLKLLTLFLMISVPLPLGTGSVPMRSLPMGPTSSSDGVLLKVSGHAEHPDSSYSAHLRIPSMGLAQTTIWLPIVRMKSDALGAAVPPINDNPTALVEARPCEHSVGDFGHETGYCVTVTLRWIKHGTLFVTETFSDAQEAWIRPKHPVSLRFNFQGGPYDFTLAVAGVAT